MIKCCGLWACSFFYVHVSHAVMLTQLFKDEGLKEERLGFFFTFLFSPSLSFLHLKGRNFLYPIFIVIVMIN